MLFTRPGRARRAAAVAGLVALGLLAGCTAGTTPPAARPGADASVTASPRASLSPSASPSPSPDAPGTPEAAPGSAVQVPRTEATIVATPDARAALETSRALFAAAPTVVLAALDDPRGQLTAASAAVALGAPMLLTGGGVDAATVADEARRLGTKRVVTVGRAPHLPGVVVLPVVAGAGARALAAATGVPFRPAVAVKKGNAARSRAVAALAGDAPVALVDGRGEAPAEKAHATPPTAAPSSSSTTTPLSSATPSSSSTATPLASATRSSQGSAGVDAPPTPAPPSRPTAPAGVVALVGTGHTPVAALATARAAGVPVVAVPGGDPRATAATVRAVAAADPQRVLALGTGFGSPATLAARIATARTGVQIPGGGQLMFPTGPGVRTKRYVALYGTPGSAALGLLGEQSVPKTLTRAKKTAARYAPLTKATVVPMVEVIATIASAGPGSDGDYSRERSVAELRPIVRAAQKRGVAVVLDLQPGRSDFLTQAKRYSSLLALPHVGLALDPEWRLTKHQVHLEQIGSVKVGEVNAVADWLAEFTAHRHLPQKMLVLHQFSLRMISDRDALDTSHDELALLIHVDGQGTQPAKRGTWKALRAGAPEVRWGWKNFVDEDHPMLSPRKTYAIRPKPDLVTYQ
ncbi:hypothetical protein [Cellulomonas edaphi]|uniref:Cell wall-binding repeat-containing protein n=1 Tax=Cellulomonas edaphi TaxID=3053468 RepID=A0ABT7S976_9CELL|nr:hypothetical protein [Cellulomons edaphi]MDM7831577.1 hypothetical protein [Cellulomons edaphi]